MGAEQMPTPRHVKYLASPKEGLVPAMTEERILPETLDVAYKLSHIAPPAI
jgi:hypothetical protein